MLAALPLAPLCGFAAEAAAPVASVSVAATRNPVEKSYRKMVDGIAVFEKSRQLALLASLRFRLLPRTPDVTMSGIILKVIGDTMATRV